jgi:peptide/nickel transport system permease protein
MSAADPTMVVSPDLLVGAPKGYLRAAGRLRRTWLGVFMVATIVAIAFVGPLVAPHSPTEFVGAPFARPSSVAWLGTDILGRDVLSRFLWGGRALLLLAMLSATIGVAAGTAVGVLSAYSRGWVDESLMRTMDILLAFPDIILALLLIAAFGPRLWLLVTAIAIAHVPRVARVTRGATLQIVRQEFVEAAEARGESTFYILTREIAPNISAPLLVEFGLRLTFSIGAIAGLGFLGLGLQPPKADWGLMINESRVGLVAQPYSVLVPVAAIAILTVGSNLVCDSIARARAGLITPGGGA